MAEPVICAGCALLCDDVTADLSAGRVELLPECHLGAQWLSARVSAAAEPAAMIDGEPADVQAALDRAAELLQQANRPLLRGFQSATIEDARAAVALADRIGAIVATAPVHGPWSGVPALGLRGSSTATLGEVRDRAQIVIVWREDPETTHPRLLDRLGFGAGASASRSDAERILVVLDDRDTPTAHRADVRLSWSADRDLEALRWLCAHQRGAATDGEPFGPELPELLATASHTAVVYGSGLTAGAGGQRRALALHDLTRALPDDRSAVTLTLASAPGTRSAEDALTWQTGYEGTVDLASGHPELVCPSEAVLAGEGVDVSLCIGGAPDPLPGVQEIALSALPVSDVAVSIRTAAPGAAAAGTAHRLDGVPMTLLAPVASHAPTATELLQRLALELAR